MRIAFPAWDGRHPWVMQVPSEEPARAPTRVAATPALVVAIDAAHRVLLVKGVPADAAGNEDAAHVTAGNLAAYWFAREHGRWVVSHRRDSVLWAGTFGDLGEVAAFDLGGGHKAVSVASGGCWSGGCVGMLDLVELGVDQASAPFPSTRVASDGLESNDLCGPALRAARGRTRPIPDELTEDNCFDIRAQWRLAPRQGGERPDIVVHFGGRELVRDAASKSLAAKAVDETQVFRYQAGAYVLVSGRNPTRDI